MSIKIENLSLQGPTNWAFKVKGGGYVQITRDSRTNKFTLWYGEMGPVSKHDHTIFLEVNRFFSVDQSLDWLKTMLGEMNRIREIQKDCNEVKKLRIEVIRHLLDIESPTSEVRLLGSNGVLINLDAALGQPASIETCGKGYRLRWSNGFTCDVLDKPEKVRAAFSGGFKPNPEAKTEGPAVDVSENEYKRTEDAVNG